MYSHRTITTSYVVFLLTLNKQRYKPFCRNDSCDSDRNEVPFAILLPAI